MSEANRRRRCGDQFLLNPCCGSARPSAPSPTSSKQSTGTGFPARKPETAVESARTFLHHGIPQKLKGFSSTMPIYWSHS